jgi:hypothetical protein
MMNSRLVRLCMLCRERGKGCIVAALYCGTQATITLTVTLTRQTSFKQVKPNLVSLTAAARGTQFFQYIVGVLALVPVAKRDAGGGSPCRGARCTRARHPAGESQRAVRAAQLGRAPGA